MNRKLSQFALSTIFIALGTLTVYGILPVGGTSQQGDYAIVLLANQSSRPTS